MRTRSTTTGGLAVLAAIAAFGCGTGNAGGAPAAAGAPRELVVRTFDFQFEMPDTIRSGPTTIRLVNDGPDFHHVWLVRLEGGHTIEELIEVLASHAPLPEWAVAVGGPNTPGAPGEETTATLAMAPGEYAVVCVIPGMQDGELHVAKGMIRPLTVVETGEAGRLPRADVVMRLVDYDYELDGEITAGRRVIEVVNEAEQPHEVVVLKLEPGRTAMDFLGFLANPEGVPPGKMIGGVTWLAKGESNLITLNFEPGKYALLCFVPDEGDGRLHLEHGMIREHRVM